MSRSEHLRRADSRPHSNPVVAEWALPEEGMAIRLQLEHLAMETLSAEARENLTLALSRMALTCDYIVATFGAEKARDTDTTACFRFLAQHMRDVGQLFEMLAGDLAPTEEDEVPF